MSSPASFCCCGRDLFHSKTVMDAKMAVHLEYLKSYDVAKLFADSVPLVEAEARLRVMGGSLILVSEWRSVLELVGSRFENAKGFLWMITSPQMDHVVRTNDEVMARIRGGEMGLFLQDGDSATYVGQCTASGVNFQSKEGPEVFVNLTQTLDRSSWLRFGGYEGWMVSFEEKNGSRVLHVETEQQISLLLDELSDSRAVGITANRYEGDMITLKAEDDLATLTYSKTVAEVFSSCNENVEPDCGEEVVFSPPSGFDYDVRLRHVVSRNESLEDLKALLLGNSEPKYLASIEISRNS